MLGMAFIVKDNNLIGSRGI